MARFHVDEAVEHGIPKLQGGRRELRFLFFESSFLILRTRHCSSWERTSYLSGRELTVERGVPSVPLSNKRIAHLDEVTGVLRYEISASLMTAVGQKRLCRQHGRHSQTTLDS
jgi:hypothetical protein